MAHFIYHAVYFDAEDVVGSVEADEVGEALSLAADDMLRQVGKDPISYGTLAGVTVECEDEGLKITVTPDYTPDYEADRFRSDDEEDDWE